MERSSETKAKAATLIQKTYKKWSRYKNIQVHRKTKELIFKFFITRKMDHIIEYIYEVISKTYPVEIRFSIQEKGKKLHAQMFAHYKTYSTEVNLEYIWNFFYYILANSDILEHIPKDTELVFEIFQKHRQNPDTGIHKDPSIYSIITYLSSPVSTELIFDKDALQPELEGYSRDLMFRFEICSPIYSLVFNNEYVTHSAPYTERVLDIGCHTQTHRRECPLSVERKIIICEINDLDEDTRVTKEVGEYSMDIKTFLALYKSKEPTKKYELTPKLMKRIENEPTLGSCKFAGGYTSKKRNSKKGRSFTTFLHSLRSETPTPLRPSGSLGRHL